MALANARSELDAATVAELKNSRAVIKAAAALLLKAPADGHITCEQFDAVVERHMK